MSHHDTNIKEDTADSDNNEWDIVEDWVENIQGGHDGEPRGDGEFTGTGGGVELDGGEDNKIIDEFYRPESDGGSSDGLICRLSEKVRINNGGLLVSTICGFYYIPSLFQSVYYRGKIEKMSGNIADFPEEKMYGDLCCKPKALFSCLESSKAQSLCWNEYNEAHKKDSGFCGWNTDPRVVEADTNAYLLKAKLRKHISYITKASQRSVEVANQYLNKLYGCVKIGVMSAKREGSKGISGLCDKLPKVDSVLIKKYFNVFYANTYSGLATVKKYYQDAYDRVVKAVNQPNHNSLFGTIKSYLVFDILKVLMSLVSLSLLHLF
ncbi:hypothetical protein CAS74_004295 [Pichia kudriavzevii]|uniref:Uncharacterized protein n=1 Tax=Pichia kudriavzevii TaxID=4909 RepID=A0A1Z8JJM4_PICKU|nr:hypothetical protein CAS74_004295 [Pichia kudriavzevii]